MGNGKLQIGKNKLQKQNTNKLQIANNKLQKNNKLQITKYKPACGTGILIM